MNKTPLEEWIRTKIGKTHSRLTRQAIEAYQLNALKETIVHVQRNSPFYRHHLRHISAEDLSDTGDIRHLPFTTADDIRKNPTSFLCVHPDRIARIATLPTSGTTGRPKRVFFTGHDLELTIDFFRHGMATMVLPGDKVLILMPGERPGGVGDLIRKGLDRLGVQGILHGPVHDPGEAVRRAVREDVRCLMGIPVQVHAMAHYERMHGICLKLRSVLLSTDRIPAPIRRFLHETWQCHVFDHYGMTEMGLGGGVECEAHAGYHLREADLFVEIVHPQSGEPLHEGEHGELVFTTLTRQGMPLIRYRTGDLSRFIPGDCPCGSVLKRLEPVLRRMSGDIALPTGSTLSIGDLDDALFSLSGLLDFTAAVTPGCLHVTCRMNTPPGDAAISRISDAIDALPTVRQARNMGAMNTCIDVVRHDAPWPCSNGTAKRTIDDRRKTV